MPPLEHVPQDRGAPDRATVALAAGQASSPAACPSSLPPHMSRSPAPLSDFPTCTDPHRGARRPVSVLRQGCLEAPAMANPAACCLATRPFRKWKDATIPHLTPAESLRTSLGPAQTRACVVLGNACPGASLGGVGPAPTAGRWRVLLRAPCRPLGVYAAARGGRVKGADGEQRGKKPGGVATLTPRRDERGTRAVHPARCTAVPTPRRGVPPHRSRGQR